MKRLTLPLIVLSTACKRPPEAPAELEELCAFLYDHLADEEPDAVVDGVNNLAEWLDGNVEALTEGYSVDTLEQSTLDALGDGDRDATKIAGAAVASTSSLAVEPVVETLILADQGEVYDGTYASYERTFIDDPDCFVAKDCDWLEMENESLATLPLSIEVETQMRAQERWVEAEVGSAMVHRGWLKEPSDGSLIKLEAQYHMAVTMPWEGGLIRVQAMWADAELVGIDMPEGGMLNMLVKNLLTADEGLYEYTEG